MNKVPADIFFLKPGTVDVIPPSDSANLQAVADNTARLSSLNLVSTGLITRAVTIGTTPTLIIDASRDRSYIIINPTPAIGLTNSGIAMAATALSVAGSMSVPLGVSNYDSLHWFFNVANASGLTMNLIHQVISPINGAWIDVQDLVPAGITANGDIYANVGNFGVTTQARIRWTIAGTCTLTVGFVLKAGLGGTSTGGVNTIFIGNNGVTTQSGYPLLEGMNVTFNMLSDAQLWGIAGQSVSINVIELA